MAVKQGRGAAASGGAQTAKKRKHGGEASGSNSAMLSETKQYPLAAGSSVKDSEQEPAKRLDAKEQKKDSEGTQEVTGLVEVTATTELTSVEEVTNVASTPAPAERVLRRLPLPAPRDGVEDEDEHTEVQISKSSAPDLPEDTKSESTVSARGRRPLGAKKAKASNSDTHATQTEVDSTIIDAPEVTRTLTEASIIEVIEPGGDAVEQGAQNSSDLLAEIAESAAATDAVSPFEFVSVPGQRRWIALVLVGLAAIGLYLLLRSDTGASAVSASASSESATESHGSSAPEVETIVEPVGPAASGTPIAEPALDTEAVAEPALDTEAVAEPALDTEAVAEPALDTEAVAEPVPSLVIEIEDEPAGLEAPDAGALLTAATMNVSKTRAPRVKKPVPPKVKRESPSAADKRLAQQTYKKGISAFMAGKLAVAEREFQSALRLDPGSALALRGLGLVYERQGETRKAIVAFRRYLRAAPGAGDADKIKARIAGME